MSAGILRKWGLAELIGPIAGVVFVTIVCFTWLGNRELRLREQLAQNVEIHNLMRQARGEMTRGYLFYVLYRNGDQSVRGEQILSYFNQSLSSIDDALNYESREKNKTRHQTLSPVRKGQIELVRTRVVAFRIMMVDAIQNGSMDDIQYRATYQLISQDLTNLNSQLLSDIKDSFRKQDMVVRLSIGIWAGSLAGVLLLLVVSFYRRDKIEEALRESEGRFRATFNQVAVGLAHVSIEGDWLMVNEKLCKMLGFNERELIKCRIEDITQADDFNSELQQRKRLLAGEISSYTMEMRCIRKNKVVMWTQLTVSLMRDAFDTPRYFISVVENIDDRKRFQADRDELLERERKARTDAESANRAKDHFLAVVSHELRTPLTPVTTSLDLLFRSKTVMAEHADTLAMMRRNIEAESQIISDLLDVARLSNNKIDLRRDVLDLHGLLSEVEQTCRSGMQKKRISWHLKPDASNSCVCADSLRITQVFTNLISNAIKFTPEGGNITVTTSNPNATTIRVEVMDDGIGIEPQVIQRLFMPFEQAEINLARRYGGLGLGLSIARNLLELHGGTLNAESQGLGCGTRFVAELPLTTESLSVKEIDTGQNATTRKRILLVEDNADTATALVRLLKSLGHDVTIAHSGSEAYVLAVENQYDLLLSDIGLPDFSGWELIRRLKVKKSIPAVALSGFGSEDDRRRSQDAGFITHLMKPVDIVRLENVINNVNVMAQ